MNEIFIGFKDLDNIFKEIKSRAKMTYSHTLKGRVS